MPALHTLLSTTHPDVGVALLTALLLGLVHGVIPDEHTWPITFSYAMGSYSTRRGLFAGLLFSLTFTLQRAIACELAWFGLSHWMQNDSLNRVLLVVIGVLMVIGSNLMREKQRDTRHRHPVLSSLTSSMPALHGFIAGWGFGAFALILYTTLAPAMPNAYWGWLPGALFGLGTAIVQATAGAFFGHLAASRNLSAKDLRGLALFTAARTLRFGGMAYVAAGVSSIIWPELAHWKLSTHIPIYGIDYLDVPLIIAIFGVIVVGLGTFFSRLQLLSHRAKTTNNS